MFSLVATKQISGSWYLRIIGISNDGKFIATKDRDSVEIYDVRSWQKIHTFNVAGVFQASFSKSCVSTTSTDNFVRIYNLTTGEMLLQKQWKRVFKPWRLKELKEMEEEGIYVPEPPIYEMKCALLSPNHKILFTQFNLPGKSVETRLHYLYDNSVIQVKKEDHDTPSLLSFSHDSKKLLCGNTEEFFIIDLENIKYLHEQSLDDTMLTAFAFSPDDTKFLIGSGLETITLWNTERCEKLRTMKHDPGYLANFTEIKKIVFSPLGDKFVSFNNRSLIFWDTESGEEIQRISRDRPQDPRDFDIMAWVSNTDLIFNSRKEIDRDRGTTTKFFDIYSCQDLERTASRATKRQYVQSSLGALRFKTTGRPILFDSVATFFGA